MKKASLLKKAASVTAAAAIGCTFTAAVNAGANLDENNTIQFSPYKIYKGTEDRVTGASVEFGTNKTYADGKWEREYISSSGTGAYNKGSYLASASPSGYPTTIIVNIDGVPAGKYTFNQYIPGGVDPDTNKDPATGNNPLSPSNHTNVCKITVESGGEIKYTEDNNFCTANLGEFNEITTDLELSGDVTITYYVPGGLNGYGNNNQYMRIDEVQLVQTESAGTSSEISITKQPEDISVALGQDTKALSVEATGENLSYQWYKKASAGGDIVINGATEAEYTPVYEGEYYAVISSEGAERVTSETASVVFEKDETKTFETGFSSGVYENGAKGVIRLMAKADIENVSEYGFMYSWKDSSGSEVISTDTKISQKGSVNVSDGFTADVNEIDMNSENTSVSARAFVYADGITYISSIINAAVDKSNEVEYIN